METLEQRLPLAAILVSDINTTGAPSSPSRLADANGTLYFRASDPVHGAELWKSDGTPEGTSLVKDIAPGALSSYLEAITPVGNRVFFTTGGYRFANALWVSDGSAEGTIQLREFGADACCWVPFEGVEFDDQLYFIAHEPSSTTPTGREINLWRSDGTPQGTELVAAIGDDRFDLVGLAVRDGRLTWATRGPGASTIPVSIWESDGTTAGTSVVATFQAPSSSDRDFNWHNRPLFAFHEGAYYFAAGTGQVRELRRFVRTPVIEPLVDELVATITVPSDSGSGLFQITSGANGVYFVVENASSGSGGVSELWFSNGTAAGTVRLGAFAKETTSRTVTVPQIAPVGGRTFFSVNNQIWSTNGTVAGTTRIKTIRADGKNAELGGIIAAGNSVYFRADDGIHGLELWTSDGTSGGTRMVSDLRQGPLASYPGVNTAFRDFGPTRMLSVGDRLYFTADDGVHGEELWVTDDSAPGVRLVADIAGDGFTASSDPNELIALGDRLFFTANDGIHGQEYWVTEGAPASTNLVYDLAAGYLSFDRPTNPLDDITRDFNITSIVTYAGESQAAVFDGKLIIASSMHPSAVPGRSEIDFYQTDGTLAGTEPLATITFNLTNQFDPVSTFASAGGRLYFTVNNSLWAFTPDLSSIGVIATEVTFFAPGLTPIGDLMYFLRRAGTTAENQTWVTAGTSSSTSLVGNPALAVNAQNQVMAALGDQLLFAAMDATLGGTLWTTDATAGGANLLLDPYPESALGGMGIVRVVDGVAFVSSGHNTPNGWRNILWSTDGTPAGTQMVLEDATGVRTDATKSTGLNGELLFFKEDVNYSAPAQLWASDGTPEGTRLVAEFASCSGSDFDMQSQHEERIYECKIQSAGDLAYFTAWDAEHGIELWQTDGTTAGTRLAADIRPGPASSAPASLTNVNGKLYFTADDGAHGREVWTIVPDALAGDFDGDGLVGLADLAILQRSLGLPASAAPVGADLNGDGTIDRGDVAAFARNFGRSSSTSSTASQAASSVAVRGSSGTDDSATTRLQATRTVASASRQRLRTIQPTAVDAVLSAAIRREALSVSRALRRAE